MALNRESLTELIELDIKDSSAYNSQKYDHIKNTFRNIFIDKE